MGRIAVIIAVSYGLLGGVAVLLIAVAVGSSTLGRRTPLDVRRLAARERTWFGIVVVVLVALLFATIFFTPYGNGAAASGVPTVDVTAQQFAFVIPGTVKAGREVQFRLTSKDVNHGFAVFDPHDTLLFQVQVMPGKTQLYRYTFTKPGTYHVVCFEYCGVGHDAMTGNITVRR